MKYQRFGSKYLLRIDRGEELIEQLSRVCELEGIRLGSISGLGAADYVRVGLYDVEKQEYHSMELEQPMEITSLMGTVTEMDGKPYFHLHINVAGEDHITRGGHLNLCRISVTGELVIDAIEGHVGRARDWFSNTGLNVFLFDDEERP